MDPISVTVTITGDTVATSVAVALPEPGTEQTTIAALREAADLIERWTAEHRPPPLSLVGQLPELDHCTHHPDTPLNLAGNCSRCGLPVRR